MQKDVEGAIDCHQQALKIYRGEQQFQEHDQEGNDQEHQEDQPQRNRLPQPPRPLDMAVTLTDLGRCMERCNRRADAVAHYLEALQLFESSNLKSNAFTLQSAERAVLRLGGDPATAITRQHQQMQEMQAGGPMNKRTSANA